MKKVVFVLLFAFGSYRGISQDTQETQKSQKASVEKSIFGVQTGVLNAWVHNELKISNQVALRSEIGIGGPNSGTITPALALESRWYYNLNKRASKGKRIDGNSGNYLSFRASYHFYKISDNKVSTLYQLLLAPTWGIRRNIGKYFNYEAGVGGGIGFRDNSSKRIGLTPYINLKIGYRF